MKNSKVLITGGTGFIGQSLVKSLEKLGFTNISAVGKNDCDLTDHNQTQELFDREKPEYVIHLAAKVGGIADIKKYPADYYYENMLKCIYVLEQSRTHNVKKFVAIGTNCSYPNNIEVPFKEEDLFKGEPQEANISYGIVKRAFYQHLVACKKQHEMDFIYLIPTNAYGENDHFNEDSGHVIPSLIKKFNNAVKTDTQVTLWGSGIATREFMYITDVSDLIAKAFVEYNDIKPLNIGTGVETSIKELAEKIAKLTNYDKEIIWDTDKPEGYLRKCLDNSRMKEHLGVSEFISLDDGLEMTIKWAIDNNIIEE